jgi:YidC/Oxa1 family membrane protein insertase
LIKLPGAFGFAIIALVILIRLVLHPLFKQQIETAKKMQSLKPLLDKVSAKHKGNPKQLQAEQMKLYQEAGINPAMGCVFMLIQLPIFIGLYNTLTLFISHGTGAKAIAQLNTVLYSSAIHFTSIDPHFFGLNLALTPQKAGVWYYYIIPIVTGILQYFQAQAQMPGPVQDPSAPKRPSAFAQLFRKDDSSVKKDEKPQDTAGDFQSAMNTQMKYLTPVMFAYLSFTFPVGLSLYWNIFSLFSIIQYRMVHKKVDPVIKVVDSVEEAEYVEDTIEGKKALPPGQKNKNKKKKK